MWPLVPRRELGVHRKGCVVPAFVFEMPTTSPDPLMPYAWLLAPPSVPRSNMWPVVPLGASGFQRNAWLIWLPAGSSEAAAASPEGVEAKGGPAVPPRVLESEHVPGVP